MRKPIQIAIIGSGISALSVAHSLRGRAEITLFEAGSYFGGHTHTVDVTLPGPHGPVTHGVDTGFLVFNERTYPNLIQLLAELKVDTAKSDMSFSVKTALNAAGRTLEWNGASLNTVFAQRRNLLNWGFITMLRDVVRFNRLATALAHEGRDAELVQPLDQFLRRHSFSPEFRDWYLLPMLGCIWSCPVDQMLQFPVSTLIRFCHNHGLIQITNRPQWWTVAGGARHYVDKIVARIDHKHLNTPVRLVERDASGVDVTTDLGTQRFDKVVMGTHSDQALALLDQPTAAERQTLCAIRYQPNRAVLHTDASVLPANPRAWAAWNYERGQSSLQTGVDASQETRVCLHYLINKLQPVPFKQPVVVTLNPLHNIAPQHVLGEYDYSHPVFDLAAVAAQARVPTLQGQQHTYFCGAWMGYGFHEDGLKAGLGVARQLMNEIDKAAAAPPMAKAKPARQAAEPEAVPA